MSKFMKQTIALLMSVMLVFCLTACGTANNRQTESNQETTTIDVSVSYPITVTDHLGRTVTIEKEPERLVSGYYITTSLLIALGLEKDLVGVEAKANTRNIYSLAADASGILSLPNVGTAKAFDLEGCVALNPDLVILPVKLKDAAASLEQLGIPVIAVNPEDQTKLSETIKMVSTATNTVAEGEKLSSFMSSSFSYLDEKLANASKPSAYLAGNSSLLSTAGPAMYQSFLMEAAGGSNVAASVSDTYWANVSYEQLLAWNPDYIFLAADANYTVESVLTDSNLAECNAVKNNHVYKLPGSIEAVDSPVPASFLGSAYMASIMHSEYVTSDYYKNLTTDFYKTFYGFTPELNEK